MDALDPRHGTHRGYVLGCRLPCCTAAQMRYMKLYRMGRKPRLISPVGTVRRIRALQAIGWSYAQIGAAVGKGENWAYMIPRSPQVTTTTASLMARAYDELCMVVPDGPYAERTRRWALRSNWPPPLAWDDIDDPDEQPTGVRVEGKRRDLLAEWHDLRDAGESIEQAAVRLGVTVGAIERAEFRRKAAA